MAASDRLYVSRADLLYCPLEWQKRGKSETATGYGVKLRTPYKIRHAGRLRRIYCRCFSNVGTCYIVVGGKILIVEDV